MLERIVKFHWKVSHRLVNTTTGTRVTSVLKYSVLRETYAPVIGFYNLLKCTLMLLCSESTNRTILERLVREPTAQDPHSCRNKRFKLSAGGSRLVFMHNNLNCSRACVIVQVFLEKGKK